MTKLTYQEAAEAKKRRQAYIHDLAIEGIHLSPEDLAILDTIERECMGYDEGVAFAIRKLKEKGLIPAVPLAAE